MTKPSGFLFSQMLSSQKKKGRSVLGSIKQSDIFECEISQHFCLSATCTDEVGRGKYLWSFSPFPTLFGGEDKSIPNNLN